MKRVSSAARLLFFLMIPLLPTSLLGQRMYQGYQDKATQTTYCNLCHPDKNATWNGTAHSQAWEALADIGMSGNATCQECHTTGFDTTVANNGFDDLAEAGGDSLSMVDVQCEVCHGPGSLHYGNVQQINYDLSAALCGRCHTDEHHPTYDEWTTSRHAISSTELGGMVGQNEECVQCHTVQAFMQYAEGQTPTVPDTAENLTCPACHDPHERSNEHQLRFPPEEICAQCHNAEGAVPGETPHHPHIEMLEGRGAYEYPGRTYISSGHTYVVTEKCVVCHMWTREFNDSTGTPAYTGHTWEPRIEACQAACHPGLTDFNKNGVQTEIEGLIDSLRTILAAATHDDSLTDRFANALFNLEFVDSDASRGVHNTEYARRVLQYAIADYALVGIGGGVPGTVPLPTAFGLLQNTPNPFNPQTTIRFDIPAHAGAEVPVELAVFSLRGDRIRTLVQGGLQPGRHEVVWNGLAEEGSRVPSGVYIYRLRAGDFQSTRKMVVLK